MHQAHKKGQFQPNLGKTWRDITCPLCKEIIGQEYIFRGRIRVRCTKCDRMVVMVFRRQKPAEGSNQA